MPGKSSTVAEAAPFRFAGNHDWAAISTRVRVNEDTDLAWARLGDQTGRRRRQLGRLRNDDPAQRGNVVRQLGGIDHRAGILPPGPRWRSRTPPLSQHS